MDPHTNLREQVAIARRIERVVDEGGAPDPQDAAELADRVLALDDWIRSGGALPLEWQEAREGLVRR